MITIMKLNQSLNKVVTQTKHWREPNIWRRTLIHKTSKPVPNLVWRRTGARQLGSRTRPLPASTELNRLGEGLNKRALYKIAAPFCSGIRSVGHADVCCNALIGLTECSTGNAGPQHLWPGLCDGSENDSCNGVMSLKLPCSCLLGNYIFRVFRKKNTEMLPLHVGCQCC